jgi:hypothetical protein
MVLIIANSTNSNFAIGRLPKSNCPHYQLWLKFIQAANQNSRLPSQNARICSQHFLPTDYVVNCFGIKNLKKESVPSIHVSQKIRALRAIENVQPPVSNYPAIVQTSIAVIPVTLAFASASNNFGQTRYELRC